MSVYRCDDCGVYYCATCDGGQDACDVCREGPLCDDCMADHDRYHAQDAKGEGGSDA